MGDEVGEGVANEYANDSEDSEDEDINKERE